MRYAPPQRWPVVLGLYLAAGAAMGVPWTEALTDRWLHKGGLGTFAAINLALPLVAAAIAGWYPRVRTAMAGAALLMAGFVLVRMLIEQPRFWMWTPSLLAYTTSPIQVAATVGYAIIGTLVALAVSPWRRVGLPDAHLRCECGYLLAGLESATCPECGRATTGQPLA